MGPSGRHSAQLKAVVLRHRVMKWRDRQHTSTSSKSLRIITSSDGRIWTQFVMKSCFLFHSPEAHDSFSLSASARESISEDFLFLVSCATTRAGSGPIAGAPDVPLVPL